MWTANSARLPTTGGSPWGAILGTDGAVYVTQGGNVPGSGDFSAVPSIQRVNADGTIEQLARHDRRASAGRPERPRLRARRPALVHRLRHRGRRSLPGAPAGTAVRDRLLRRRRAACWSGPNVYPTASPSTPRAVSTGPSPWGIGSAGLENGQATTFAQLSDGHVPDGMAFAADGRASSARRSRAASPCSRPRARCSRRSCLASARRTASSTARRCTSPPRRSPTSASDRPPASSGA